MGSTYQGVPTETVSRICSHFALEVFVETGTYEGDTAAWASSEFQRVHTVEASRQMFELASKRLSTISNVEAHFGDSREVLPELVQRMTESAFYWLDAHWSGGNTSGQNDECPVLDEISIVTNTTERCVVAVDDARLFLCPPPKPHDLLQWPTISELSELLGKLRYNFVIDEDVLYAMHEDSFNELRLLFQEIVTRRASRRTTHQSGSSGADHAEPLRTKLARITRRVFRTR